MKPALGALQNEAAKTEDPTEVGALIGHSKVTLQEMLCAGMDERLTATIRTMETIATRAVPRKRTRCGCDRGKSYTV